MRRRMSLLVSLIVASLLLGGCAAHGGSHPAAKGSWTSTGALSARNVTDQLQTSWNTNGHTGFFVDATGPVGTDQSLPQTYWWTRVLLDAKASSHVAPNLLRKWVTPLAEGVPDRWGENASLPPLERLDLAIRLAHATKMPLDTAKVRAALLKLKHGAQFSFDEGSGHVSWSATASVVRDLALIGSPLPADTVRAAQAIVATAKPAPSAGIALNVYLPTLLIGSSCLRAAHITTRPR